jgi:hypothetical protein
MEEMPFLQRGQYEPVDAFRQRLKDSASCMAMICGQNAEDPRFIKLLADIKADRAAERAANMEPIHDSAA